MGQVPDIHPAWCAATPPPAFDKALGDASVAEIFAKFAVVRPDDTAMLDALQATVIPDVLASTFSASPYLHAILRRTPELISEVFSTDPVGYFNAAVAELDRDIADATSLADAMRLLRQFKSRMAFAIGLADSGRVLTTAEAVERISDVADRALQAAVGFLFRQAGERGEIIADVDSAPEAQSGLFVLAMGKHGGRELNYSSDIDLIVFYDPSRGAYRDGVERQVFFIRLVRLLVKLMQDQTADGYVYRTDLRLRPDPGSTQIVIPTGSAFNYYEAQGQNWERAAFIKARAVAGDIEAGEQFLAELAPFIWRKYLDYASIADVHAMKRQIHASKGFGTIRVAGHNIKLGRGGIREVEFFAQTQQLIAGGRQPHLRVKRTVDALAGLAERNWITAAARDDLTDAYWFFRHVENRIQMIADEQTHMLPTTDEKLLRLARFSGFETVKEFSAILKSKLETVQGHYAALFEDVPELTTGRGNLVFVGDSADPDTLQTLSAMGFSQPESVWQTVRSWHFGRYPAMRSARTRERLTELQPKLLEAFAETASPDTALVAFDRFLADLPAGVQLFGLLRSNPSLLALLAMIMGTAPRLQQLISRRRRVLEALLDPGFFGELPSESEMERLVEVGLAGARDLQDELDRARVVGNEQSFLLGVRLLSGVITPEEAGAAYARLAAHLIARLHGAVAADLRRQYGTVPAGDTVVLAMGKLGGGELTASSDVDLILIYDFEGESAQSDGAKPLAAPQYYARLTQRLVSAIASPTAEGRLYEVDMRLRPSGNAGPIATRLRGFESYQRDDAWTWEQMALTRARCLTGGPTLRTAVEAAIQAALTQPRGHGKLVSDVREMREKIAAHKGGKTIWDIKTVQGGQVDLEFIVQFAMLAAAENKPEVLHPNLITAIEALGKADVFDRVDVTTCLKAARLYAAVSQILALCLTGPFVPESAPRGLREALLRATGQETFEALIEALATTQAQIGDLFERVVV